MSFYWPVITRSCLGAFLLCGAFPHLGWAADSQAMTTLIEQGKYWQTHRRSDLATQTWQKLLLLDPAQSDALNGMVLSELDKNNSEAARTWLARLTLAHPADPQVARLKQAIDTRSGMPTPVDQARQLAKSGKNAEAVRFYQQQFGDKPPAGELGVEYYQTLAGTPKGWEEARLGLERLEKDNPDASRYALAYAQHLSYREPSRPEAIARLSRLASRSDVGRQAVDAWRAALLWTATRPADRGLYEAFLAVRKDDTAVREKLDAVLAKASVPGSAMPVLAAPPRAVATAAPAAAATPARQAASAGTGQTARQLRSAFGALNDNDLDTSASSFEAILQGAPGQADALGGLGVIRLRQRRFADAQGLLERASKAGNSAQWGSALKNARYWNLLQKADAARLAGDFAQAQALSTQAIGVDAHEVAAKIVLAQVRVELRQYDAAEKLLAEVLVSVPGQSAAISAYADLLARQDKFEQAMRMLSRLTPAQREQLGGIAQMQSTMARKRATTLQEEGQLDQARVALEDAMAFDPASAWVRLDLGHLYLQMALASEARSIIDGLLMDGSAQPESLYAAALLQAETLDWNSSLQSLEQVPSAARTPSMATLQKRVMLHVLVQRAIALAQAGNVEQAAALLRQAASGNERDDAQMATLAGAYADIGQAPQALSLMRGLLSRGSRDNTDLQMQYAQVLLSTHQDAEFINVVRMLQDRIKTPQQATRYAELRTGYLLRLADTERENGHLARAYEVLMPVLKAHPADPKALATLARMYSAAGAPGKALQQYDQALLAAPRDIELILGAQSAAIDAKNLDTATLMGERASSIDPTNARVLSGWARTYRAQGKNSKADMFYQAALASERSAGASLPGQPRGESNPFAAPERQSARSTPVETPFPAATRSTSLALRTPFGDVMPTMAFLPAAQEPYLPAARATPADNRQTRAVQAADQLMPVAARTARQTVPAKSYQFDAGASVLPLASADAFTEPQLRTAAPERSGTAFPGSALHDEVDGYAQQRSSSITGQLSVRQRSGTSGLDQLSDLQTGIDARVRAGDGHVTIRLTPTTLDAGALAPDVATASRFGSGPVAALANAAIKATAGTSVTTTSGAGSQRASGVGIALGYVSPEFNADVGTTPLGFDHVNAIGGLRYSHLIGDQTTLSVGVFRRAVTDSLLAFAGTTDARTGVSWGGVTATGVRADIGWDASGYGLYGYGKLKDIEGTQVASNAAIEVGGGMYVNLIKNGDTDLTSGLSATMMGYRKNLSNFTYGNGGYFSPQKFLSLTVPLNWSGTNGKLGYVVQGNVGLAHMVIDDAPYFPANAALQASALSAATSGSSTLTGVPVFSGQTKTAFSYNVQAGLEYHVSPQLTLGGVMVLDNSRDFREWSSGVYLHFALDGSNKVSPPKISRSVYAASAE